ncbi:hypothetical protein WMY93_019679 [Mugilogobius chulae]|uniref:Endothelin-like toxin domain-containing protein n=1 Tax=Mugilogobius chulae TaxID=88201 RepID=A0AAW0NRU9_9GOBI
MARLIFQAMFAIIIVALHEGCGIPLSSSSVPASTSSSTSSSSGQVQQQQVHARVKRCSCNSWEDKECIYFCHLDIIWVNTPSKLLPYGLGNPSSPRRRRSPRRCECADPNDPTCSTFCRNSSEKNAPKNTSKMSEESARLSDNKLLQSLRSAIKSNTQKLSSKKHHTKIQQQQSSTLQ